MFISTYLHQHNALIVHKKKNARSQIYSEHMHRYPLHAHELYSTKHIHQTITTIQQKKKPKQNNEHPNCFHEIDLDYVHLTKYALVTLKITSSFQENKNILLADYQIAIKFFFTHFRFTNLVFLS